MYMYMHMYMYMYMYMYVHVGVFEYHPTECDPGDDDAEMDDDPVLDTGEVVHI